MTSCPSTLVVCVSDRCLEGVGPRVCDSPNRLRQSDDDQRGRIMNGSPSPSVSPFAILPTSIPLAAWSVSVTTVRLLDYLFTCISSPSPLLFLSASYFSLSFLSSVLYLCFVYSFILSDPLFWRVPLDIT
ncbi:hypothetical protein BO82DRAFT_183661 [Aspergillus uvarum CBS 121591]|uniref:Uncharacterized protein n=1 Tax=Aspergillus uvarum CBS 121591 TaxID=1448315 RepID=A0A319CJD7_9EURO|nr:hypothetical protein BO82DRAFT_183661 [Aspergillus uvarum CBS 121591]PYH85334.1 hypothetical protein BO82DRAFT_183661 [Aspergillus uvarum CBS 121591]